MAANAIDPWMRSTGIPDDDAVRYADVILDIAAPVRADDLVLINTETDYAPFARLLAEGAYARGARYVDIWYFDPYARLSRLRHAASSTLADVPAWIDRRHPDLAAAGGVLINLRGQSAPDLTADIDPRRAGLDRMPALESRIAVQVQQLVPWTIAFHPSHGWASTVYGEPDVERLWSEMRHFLRLDTPNPQAAWRERLNGLRTRAEQLNDLELDAVHFHGPGTDLTIGLIPQAHWATAELRSADGRVFQAVLPTEEVYITPDHRRVDGVVRSTRPLALGGTVVRDLELTFRDGRVSNVRARTGADAVRASQATDSGAARLGELALVDRTSPINRSASIFTETGLDENAACHLAWGAGLWSSIPRARSRSADELQSLGVNSSGVHIDFMVGAPDVTVTGILPDGRTAVLLENETWQL